MTLDEFNENNTLKEVKEVNWIAFLLLPVFLIAYKLWFGLVVTMLILLISPKFVLLPMVYYLFYGNRRVFKSLGEDHDAYRVRKVLWPESSALALMLILSILVLHSTYIRYQEMPYIEAYELAANDNTSAKMFDFYPALQTKFYLDDQKEKWNDMNTGPLYKWVQAFVNPMNDEVKLPFHDNGDLFYYRFVILDHQLISADIINLQGSYKKVLK